MKQYLLIAFAALIVIASCKENELKHLPPQKIQQVLFDISTAEAYSIIIQKDSMKKISDKNMDSLAKFYARIFKHYHITQADFDQSMDWYKKHPEELDSIYTKMIPEMTKLDTSKKD